MPLVFVTAVAREVGLTTRMWNSLQVTPSCFNRVVTCDWDSLSNGYRSDRITTMIKKTSNHSLQSMKRIQLDYHSCVRTTPPALKRVCAWACERIQISFDTMYATHMSQVHTRSI